MSYLKFSENLFLEVAEFKRFQKFMNDEGFKRHFLLNTDNFGLIRQASLPEIGNIDVDSNFYVAKTGTPFDSITVNPGLAMDLNGNLIVNSTEQKLSVPSNSLWYWIKIKHKYDSVEKGTLSIDNLGQVTGVGTEFTQILRGQPNFPSKIKFTNSQNGNAYEYEVVKVISDTQLILQGDFVAETNLKYSIIGTFTAGADINPANKNIFQYDSVDISLVQEVVLNTPPAYALNSEFYIGRVRNNNINLSLQDKRSQWWQTEAVASLKTLNRTITNPLIGVENVKWDVATSTKDKNWIEMAWGFRFASWTIDTSAKRISILIGNGGKYKDTSQFQNGNFNGWRLYSKNGKYQTIIDSIKTGTQIIITLDVLNPEDYANNDLLFACPPYEEIEVRVRRDGAILDTGDQDGNNNTTETFPYPNLEEIHNFSINTPLARFQVPALNGCYKYNLTYRFKVFNDYSDWLTFPSDSIGFYKEQSFDIYGNLNPEPIDRVRLPYTGHSNNGFITVCENAQSYDNFKQVIDTGDLFGVNTRQFSNATPLIQLQVSRDKRYQYFQKGNGTTLTLSSDFYVNLRKFKDDANTIPCREGNTFIIHIDQWIDLSTFKLRIVQNYVNPTSFDTVADLDANDMAFIKNNTNIINGNLRRGIFITCTFNENGNWICHYDTDVQAKGSVKMAVNVGSENFNVVTGEGITAGFFGWKIMANMKDVFPMGTDIPSEAGTVEGSNNKTLTINEMPNHTHNLKNNIPKTNFVQAGGEGNDDTLRLFTADADSISYTGGGQPFDVRPKRMKLVFLQKIV